MFDRAELMKLLVDAPRLNLRKVGLFFSKYEPLIIEDGGEDEISINAILQGFMQSNYNVANLAIYVRVGNQELKRDLQQFEQTLKMANMDIKTNFEVVVPKHSFRRA